MYACMYVYSSKNTQLMKQKWKNRKDHNQALLCVVFFIKICTNCAFLGVFQPFLLRSFILISLMSEALRIWILSVRLSFFALILIERHRSQNKGLLKSEERLRDFKERCAQLCILVQKYSMCWKYQKCIYSWWFYGSN